MRFRQETVAEFNQRHNWHLWFAWRPVCVQRANPKTVVWLEWVWRRKRMDIYYDGFFRTEELTPPVTDYKVYDK